MISAPPVQLEQAAGRPGEPLRMSFEDFLKWEHNGIAEWVNGEVTVMAVKNEHQRIVDFLIQVMGIFARLLKLGIIRSAPYAMRIAAGGSAREPDLMFVSAEHQARVTSDFLDGPADLVVEVVSDESVARDYDEKFSEYQNGGVREYWIIDPRPDRQRASFFVRDAQGRFRPVATDDEGIYRSTVLPGFWLKLDWFWLGDAEPDPVAALAQLIGPERLAAALNTQP